MILGTITLFRFLNNSDPHMSRVNVISFSKSLLKIKGVILGGAGMNFYQSLASHTDGGPSDDP